MTTSPIQMKSNESVAGIILAAGAATRFGAPKILANWGDTTFIRHIAEQALDADLDPVIVVLGATIKAAKAALNQLPVMIIINRQWVKGQSSSIKTGLRALKNSKAAIFLLADQPQVTQTLIRSLVEEFRRTHRPIIAPLVQGKRGNPILFDQTTFDALNLIEGDQGGRAIFSKFPIHWLEWHDESILVDIDTPSDLQKLGG